MKPANEVLESKLRLIRAELKSTAEDQRNFADGPMGPSGNRHFDRLLKFAQKNTDALIDAYLGAAPRMDDGAVAEGIRNELDAILRLGAIVATPRNNPRVEQKDQVTQLMKFAEPHFASLEDRVRSRRHDLESKDTHLDRLLRRAKNHPVIAWALLVAIALGGLKGVVDLGVGVVGLFRSAASTAPPAPTATPLAAPAPAPAGEAP